MGRIWVLGIPAPAIWLNANDRGPWQRRVPVVRVWREATYWAAVKAKLPKGLERIHVEATFHFPTRRARDAENYHATLKPCIDALGPQKTRAIKGKFSVAVGYGLIVNDTPEHLSTNIVISPERRPRYVELLIKEVMETQ